MCEKGEFFLPPLIYIGVSSFFFFFFLLLLLGTDTYSPNLHPKQRTPTIGHTPGIVCTHHPAAAHSKKTQFKLHWERENEGNQNVIKLSPIGQTFQTSKSLTIIQTTERERESKRGRERGRARESEKAREESSLRELFASVPIPTLFHLYHTKIHNTIPV